MTTKPYRVCEVEDAGKAACTCDNCGDAMTADVTMDIVDCSLTPGDASPVGRCPKCDGLVYLDKPLRGEVVDVAGALGFAQCLVEDMERGLSGDVEFDDDSWEASLVSATSVRDVLAKLKNGASAVDSQHVLVNVCKDVTAGEESFSTKVSADGVGDIISHAILLINLRRTSASADVVESAILELEEALSSQGLIEV